MAKDLYFYGESDGFKHTRKPDVLYVLIAFFFFYILLLIGFPFHLLVFSCSFSFIISCILHTSSGN